VPPLEQLRTKGRETGTMEDVGGKCVSHGPQGGTNSVKEGRASKGRIRGETLHGTEANTKYDSYVGRRGKQASSTYSVRKPEAVEKGSREVTRRQVDRPYGPFTKSLITKLYRNPSSK